MHLFLDGCLQLLRAAEGNAEALAGIRALAQGLWALLKRLLKLVSAGGRGQGGWSKAGLHEDR